MGADVDPVREFITHGRNGLLTPTLDPQALARSVLEVLENDTLNRRLRNGARRYAEQNLDMDAHIEAFTSCVGELTGEGQGRRPWTPAKAGPLQSVG